MPGGRLNGKTTPRSAGGSVPGVRAGGTRALGGSPEAGRNVPLPLLPPLPHLPLPPPQANTPIHRLQPQLAPSTPNGAAETPGGETTLHREREIRINGSVHGGCFHRRAEVGGEEDRDAAVHGA